MIEKYGVAKENFSPEDQEKKKEDKTPLEKQAGEKNPAVKMFEEMEKISTPGKREKEKDDDDSC